MTTTKTTERPTPSRFSHYAAGTVEIRNPRLAKVAIKDLGDDWYLVEVRSLRPSGYGFTYSVPGGDGTQYLHADWFRNHTPFA